MLERDKLEKKLIRIKIFQWIFKKKLELFLSYIFSLLILLHLRQTI